MKNKILFLMLGMIFLIGFASAGGEIIFANVNDQEGVIKYLGDQFGKQYMDFSLINWQDALFIRASYIAGQNRVGIGTTSPVARLDVQYDSNSTATLNLGDTTANCTHNPEPSTERVVCTSDKSLKINIQSADTKGITDKLMNINLSTFNLKTDPNGPSYTGLIAQDVQNVFPDEVSLLGDNSTLGVESMSGWEQKYLVVIQEQQKQINAMNATLNRICTANKKLC